jgi:4-hydroxyphenylpyruvate dioxygenase-like putative hemolysin
MENKYVITSKQEFLQLFNELCSDTIFFSFSEREGVY